MNKLARFDPLKDGKSSIRLISTTPQITFHAYDEDDNDVISSLDLRVIEAARISTGTSSLKSFVKDKKLIQYLAKHGHYTPFEHTILSYMVKAPIFVIRQWFRHRAFSYNEESARYKDKSSEAQFYIPNQWHEQNSDNKQGSGKVSNLSPEHELNLTTFSQNGLMYYNLAVSDNIAREEARLFLPINMYSCFVVTGNMRNWLWNFCAQRNTEHAQYEIRVYAKIIEETIQAYAPMTYGAFINRNK